MIKGLKGKTYKESLEKLGITSLEERHHRADMIQVYKILNDKTEAFPANFLTLSDRPGRLNTLKLYKSRTRLDICKHSFTSRVVNGWNDLPDEVIRSGDLGSFKGNFDRSEGGVRGQS